MVYCYPLVNIQNTMENHNCYWYNYRKSPFLSGKSAISMAIFGHMVIPGHPTDHCPEKAGRCPGAPRHLLYMGGRLGIGDTINKKNMDIYIYMIAVYIYDNIKQRIIYIYAYRYSMDRTIGDNEPIVNFCRSGWCQYAPQMAIYCWVYHITGLLKWQVSTKMATTQGCIAKSKFLFTNCASYIRILATQKSPFFLLHSIRLYCHNAFMMVCD